MPHSAETSPSLRRLRRPAMNLAVDIGFALLLLVCALRYFSRHPLAGEGILVLLLAMGTGASYATAVIGRRRATTTPPSALVSTIGARQRIGLLAATGFWLPLVVMAPSFGWCAFALFLAVHRVLRGRVAFLISGVIVIAVSVGLLMMSRGEDLGLVLGPFFGGLVLSYAYAALDQALTAQRALNAELLETREQLARSERDAGALAERGRVASELHDTVVQRAASALLLLESNDLHVGDSSAAVNEARVSLRNALVETRQLLHGLTAPRSPAASLASAVQTQSQTAGAVFGMVGVERPVSDAVAHAIQRVVQEALLNIHKHANAETIHVNLTYTRENIVVEITDDGIGFPRADDQIQRDDGGFGVRAMTWRIRNQGGELTIQSDPSHGTIVTATVPITGEDARE